MLPKKGAPRPAGENHPLQAQGTAERPEALAKEARGAVRGDIVTGADFRLEATLLSQRRRVH